MKPVVHLQNASKAYRLGLVRTSLPAAVSRRVRSLFGSARKTEETHHWALRDLTFELKHGESLALVGPNGAGKTTVLKLLARITKPTHGKVNVNGRLSALLELGAGFHPDLTGRENIFLNGTILGLSRSFIRSRFDEIVAFSELERFIDTPLKRYSSGMVVRLGFSVASCINPDVLLIDEVLAVGDAQFRQKCMNRIRELVDGGTSIVFVSHNLYMVQAICRQALYIRAGGLVKSGDTLSIIKRYEEDIHRERAVSFDLDNDTAIPSLTAPADFTAVHVSTLGGEPGTELESDRPGVVTIEYTAYTDAEINIALFVIRSDGMTCAMVRSQVDGVDLRLTRGQGVIRIMLDPVQLATGSYFAEVEMTDPADTMVLHPQPARSDWFTVKGRTRNYDHRSGVFEPCSKWELEAMDYELQESRDSTGAAARS